MFKIITKWYRRNISPPWHWASNNDWGSEQKIKVIDDITYRLCAISENGIYGRYYGYDDCRLAWVSKYACSASGCGDYLECWRYKNESYRCNG